MKKLKWLAIDSFFAGLMLFGFLQTLVDHKIFFSILFAILCTIDISKAQFEYKQVKDNLIN